MLFWADAWASGMSFACSSSVSVAQLSASESLEELLSSELQEIVSTASDGSMAAGTAGIPGVSRFQLSASDPGEYPSSGAGKGTSVTRPRSCAGAGFTSCSSLRNMPDRDWSGWK